MFETITDKLSIVHGGAKTQAELMAGGQTMQGYLDCYKQAQDKSQTGQAAAMTKAQKGAVTEGMTDLLSVGKTLQGDMGACAAKFPIK
jgi:membrane protease subunit (stomatin/prohibitin family)